MVGFGNARFGIRLAAARLTFEEYGELQSLAARTGETVTAVVTRIMREEIAKNTAPSVVPEAQETTDADHEARYLY